MTVASLGWRSGLDATCLLSAFKKVLAQKLCLDLDVKAFVNSRTEMLSWKLVDFGSISPEESAQVQVVITWWAKLCHAMPFAIYSLASGQVWMQLSCCLLAQLMFTAWILLWHQRIHDTKDITITITHFTWWTKSRHAMPFSWFFELPVRSACNCLFSTDVYCLDSAVTGQWTQYAHQRMQKETKEQNTYQGLEK